MPQITAEALLHVFAAADANLLRNMLQAIAEMQADFAREVSVYTLPEDLQGMLQNMQQNNNVQVLTMQVLANYAD